ncbi:MAG: NAD-dependent epimerase/dehydratase family protein, partial [Candidatus Zixiibacteriota bacterium]
IGQIGIFGQNFSNIMDLSNKQILITGASGRLAQQIIYELNKLGIRPIAQVRPDSNTSFIDSLKLEKRVTDLRNRTELPALVKDIDFIIHTVAIIDFRQDRFTQFAGINTIAAIDIFNAAVNAGVKRFVHVSSAAAIGGVLRTHSSDELRGDINLADESHPFNLERIHIPYILTKRAAETELLKLSNGGSTNLVIVNPSIVMAPSRSGDDRAKAKKRLKGFIVPDLRNRVNLVDIRDVAKGVIGALKQGKHRERYILGGDNITVRELILAISIELGKTPHLFKFPKGFFQLTSRMAVFFARLTGKSKISYYPDLVKLLDYDWAFSSMKARNELGYTNRSIYTSLKELLNNEFTDTYIKPL